jgi:hypothetical protein
MLSRRHDPHTSAVTDSMIWMVISASLARTVYDRLPGYAVPVFIRVVDSLEHTATVKTKKLGLREQGYGPDVGDPVYVLNGREEGYVPYYYDYPDEVAAGKQPPSDIAAGSGTAPHLATKSACGSGLGPGPDAAASPPRFPICSR